VSYNPVVRKWVAVRKVGDGKTKYLGCFSDELQAALAYDRYVSHCHRKMETLPDQCEAWLRDMPLRVPMRCGIAGSDSSLHSLCVPFLPCSPPSAALELDEVPVLNFIDGKLNPHRRLRASAYLKHLKYAHTIQHTVPSPKEKISRVRAIPYLPMLFLHLVSHSFLSILIINI
jgi:hypothetical protein